MADIILAGSTSGSITVSSPAISGTNTLTLPAVTDTLVGKATTDTLTNKTVTAPVLSGTVTGTYTLGGTPTLTSPTITGASISTMASSVITSGTAVASTSGTSITFTGIPSWVKRVTVMFVGVSTNDTSHYQIQIGDSGGIETSGYAGNFSLIGPTVAGATNITSGFGVYNDSAGDVIHGQAVFSLFELSTNTWVVSGLFGRSSNNYTSVNAASKSLSATLDRLRITTITGTATFDAGSINILYE